MKNDQRQLSNFEEKCIYCILLTSNVKVTGASTLYLAVTCMWYNHSQDKGNPELYDPTDTCRPTVG